MPNIEIFGFDCRESNDRAAGALLAHKIWHVLEDVPYREGVVLTAINSTSRNSPAEGFGEAQRFLRIWATSQREADDIVNRLDLLDIDIEVAPLLTMFIEKRSVRLQRKVAHDKG